jgi:hypothetical protein
VVFSYLGLISINYIPCLFYFIKISSLVSIYLVLLKVKGSSFFSL